jgi:hypothetical protein
MMSIRDARSTRPGNKPADCALSALLGEDFSVRASRFKARVASRKNYKLLPPLHSGTFSREALNQKISYPRGHDRDFPAATEFACAKIEWQQ